MTVMRLGPYEFRPSLPLSLLAALVFVGLLSLGNWQMNRADQKRDLLEQFSERSSASPVPISLAGELSDDMRYRHVQSYGVYDGEHQFLLDNRIRDGVPGYEVLTPLKVPGSDRAVLVNRGWIPLGEGRERLPNVDLDAAEQLVRGTLYMPLGETFSLGGMDEGVVGWPRRIQFLDFAVLEQRLGYPIAPFTVRLDSGASEGYRRDWEPVAFPPERHVAYAVQWYGLAILLLILFLVLNTRRIDRI